MHRRRRDDAGGQCELLEAMEKFVGGFAHWFPPFASKCAGGDSLAHLQGADIGNDGPAVRGGDAVAKAVHCASAVGDDIEKVADGGGAEAVDVVAGRMGEAALDDDALAIAGVAVTHGAVEGEFALAVFENGTEGGAMLGERAIRFGGIVIGEGIGDGVADEAAI